MKGSTSRHDVSHTGVALPAWEHLYVWSDRVCLYTTFNFGFYGVEGSIRLGADKENHGHLQAIHIFDFTMIIGMGQLPASIPGGNVSCAVLTVPWLLHPFRLPAGYFHLQESHSYP